MSDRPDQLDRDQTPNVAGGASAIHQSYFRQYVSWGLMQCWLSLTPREREVVILLCHNYTNNQIAERLIISPETVRSYIKASLRKFGVHSRIELRWLLSEWQFERRDGES